MIKQAVHSFYGYPNQHSWFGGVLKVHQKCPKVPHPGREKVRK